jgi:antitoxin CcdA
MNHVRRTEAGYDVEAPKKRVNITINGDLVRVAQAYTDNLSGTIEALLASWVQSERRRQEDDREHQRKVVAAWNDFDERHGRFADEWNGAFMPEDGDR